MVLYYVFTAYALRAFLLPSRLLKHPLSLGWRLVNNEETRLTAQGETQFNVYAGTVSLDG